ncbi:MAG: hypothetical protein V4502_11850 [Pseudomonadota bacterium]
MSFRKSWRKLTHSADRLAGPLIGIIFLIVLGAVAMYLIKNADQGSCATSFQRPHC